MRKLDRLSAAKIPHLKPGRYCDGGGLYLCLDRGRSAWLFRYRSRVTGKLRDKGLGPLSIVSLSEARKRAQACRLQLLDGIDPIDAKRERIEAQRTARANAITFRECAEQYIEKYRASWRNAKHAAQWTATLKTYAAPINELPVDAINARMILKCLEPEWATKNETMTRVRQRIEAVLDFAPGSEHRSGGNPARWKGNLDKWLPEISKKQRVQHRPALPYAEMGDFMVKLRARGGMGARCLEFQILTAARPGEAAGAQWDEIDLDAAVWTVPAARMKASAEHRVPLSAPAVALLRALPRVDGNVFPGVHGRPITTAAGMALLKDVHPGITAHGFRSTFRDWAGDATAFQRDVIEEALAHTIKNAAEAAYRRGDAFRKRTRLMDAWADWCATTGHTDVVTPIRRKVSGASR